MRRNITPFLMIFLFIIGMSFSVQAQITKPGTPLSIEQSAPDVTITEEYTPSVDWNQIAQQDAMDRDLGFAPRGGLSVPVGRRITEFGEWMLMPNGDVMWRVKLQSNNAKALGVVFSDFYLAPNTELYVYDENKTMIAGAFTSDNNHSSMQFSTRLLPTSTIIIEYIERGAGVNLMPEKPKPYGTVNTIGGSILTNYQPQTNFRIDELIYMYTDVYAYFDQSRPATGSSAACQVNIRCTPVGDNWVNQKRGVAHIVFREGASWYYCSGTLVNNTLQNGTPYFLTAHHCGGTASAADRNVWQFYFNYERPTCDNTGAPSTSDMMTGCVYRAGAPIAGGSDFQLVELNNNMPAGYNAFYNGWDRSATGATSGASIHHPAGDVKKISTFTAQLTSSTPNIGGSTFATNAAWRVVWSSNANGWGVTEGGSSGSPIFNQHGRVVGDLSGGSSMCTNQTAADFYGKFDYAWESNGVNANQRLRPWLDPAGTNPTFLDGWDPTWVSAPPVANFSGTPTTIMAGQSVQFNDLSTNGPNQWAWTITGAYPATSTERNPVITFITPGQYTVSLTSTNGFGSDTETKVNYITVTPYSGSPSPITIGTGTTSGGIYPLGINTQGTATGRFVYTAAIYTKAELGNAGVITQVQYQTSTSRTDSRSMRLYMKHTSDNTFAGGQPFSSYTTGATLVYEGPFIPNVAGWFAFALQTHFNYNGLDNLMILTEVTTAINPGNNPSNCYYTTSTGRHQQWNGAAAPTGNGTVNANRPNVRITKNPYAAPVANFAGFNSIMAADFEETTFPPTGWTINNVDGAGSTWAGSTSFNHTNGGLRSAAHEYSNVALQDGYLISPQITTLPAGASLSFWSYNEWPTYYGGTYQGKNSVLISTTGTAPANFTEIWTPATVSAAWVQTILDLSAYAGQNIYIAFRYQGNDAHSWFLDDVNVATYNYTQISTFEGDPLSIFDMSTNNPSVWQWSNPGAVPTSQYNQNADLVYNVAGLYNVSLTAANPAGSNTKTVNNYVNVIGRAPISNFNGIGNLKTVDYRPFIPVGGTVTYENLSSRVPTAWSWTFNGGSPAASAAQTPPVITYGAPGLHNTVLQTTNSHGTNTMDSAFVFVGGTQYVSNWYPLDNLAAYNYENGLLPGHAADASGRIYRYAEYFSNAYAGQITNVDLALFRAQGVGKNVTIAIWDGSTGTPGAVLWSTTQLITTYTEGAWNTVPVTPALNVTGSFFVGYQLNYDGTHNYTTHQFCGFMTQFRSVGAPHSAWFSYGNASPGTWYSFKDGFDIESALLIYPEFTYASTGPVATVTATPGCGTGTVRVTSSENTNQTFHLTDNVGTILQSWTGNATFRDFTGLADGTYRGQVVVGVQTSPLSAAVVLTNSPVTVGGAVSGINPEICLGSNTGTLTLSGHTGTVLRWQRRVNAGAWTDIAHTAATYSEIPGTAGTWEFRAEVQSGTCAAAFSSAYSIIVHPSTVAGTVTGVNPSICLGQSTGTLTLSGYTGSILRWQVRYNAGAWTDIAHTAATYSATPALAGTYEYRAEVRSGTCAAAFSASYTITVSPLSVGGTVTGTNTQICLGAATGTMTLAGHTGTIVRWERRFNAGAWQNIANTTITHSETPGAAGVYEYRAVLQSGTCAEANSAIHTITVHPVSVGGTVSGATTQICLGQATGTMTLAGHTGTIVRWQRRVNAGGWVNIANTITTYSETPASAGVWEYRAEIQSGNCASTFSTAHSITVHPTTVGGTVSSATTQICLGSATGTMTLAGHTGTIVRWERRINAGAWQNIANTTTTHSETPATAGTYEYRAVLQSGTCATANSAIHTITVHPLSVGGTVSSATTQICLGSATGTMTLAGHTGTIVRWQRSIDGGVWQNIANTTTTHSETPATAGTYQYRAEIQSGNCASTFSATHTITVNPLSVGGTVSGATTQICLGLATGTMTLAGHNGTIVRWQRSIDGGAWQNIANTATTYAETPGTAGTYQYRAEVQSGNCASTFSAAHSITVHPLTVGGSVTGTNTEICLGAATGTMTLAGHTGTIVRWERRFNAGAWQNIANTTTTHSETPGAAGVYEYRAVLQSGTCAEANSAIHTITVNPASVGGNVSGTNTEICLGVETGTMTLSGHIGTIVRWERRFNAGAWQNIANTTTTHSETPVTAGVYEYRAVVQSGSCGEVFSSAHSITVHPVTVAGTVTTATVQIFLGEPSGNISLSGYTGNIVRWQKRLNAGMWTDIAFTGAVYSETPNAVGFWDYRAVVQSGTCNEVFTNLVTIEVLASNAGGVTGGNSPICLGSNTGIMTLTGYSGSIIRWERRVDAGVWTSIVNTTDTYSEVPATAGTWEYRAVVFTTIELFSAPATIVVNPLTVGGTVSGISEICLGSSTGVMSLGGNIGAVLKWQKRFNFGPWTDIANTGVTYSETPATAGTWEYRAEVQSGVCAAQFSLIHSITVHPVTVGGSLSGTNTEICLGVSTGTMTLSGHTGSIVRWERRFNAGAWQNIANTTTTHSETPVTAGVYEYRAVVQSGNCTSVNSTVHTITVYPVTVGGSVTPLMTNIFLGQNTGVLTLSGHVGSVVKWQKRHDGGAWTDIANTNAVYSETPGLVGTWEYRAVLESGTCGQQNSAIATVVVQASAAGNVTGGNSPICLGVSTGTMTLTGYTGTILRWQKSLDGGVWTDIVNTLDTYSEIPSSAGSWQYRAVVFTTSEMFSASQTIIVDPVVVPGTLTGGGLICIGASTPLMTLSAYTGNIVKWEYRFNGGAWTDISNTNATYSEVPSVDGTYEYRVLVESGACGSAYSNIITVNVDPAVAGGTLDNSGQTICLGSQTPLFTLTAYSGTIVKWQKSDDGSIWTDIANTAATYQETPSAAGTWYYRAEITSGACGSVYSSVVIVNVDPATNVGTLNGVNTSICLGNPTGNMTLVGYSGSILKWEYNIDGGPWTDIIHTGAIYNETPLVAGLYGYRVEIQSGVCAAEYSDVHYINVFPAVVAGTVGSNNTICLGSSTGTLTLTGYTGNVVKWQKSDDGTSWTDIVNTNDTYSEIPSSAGIWYYRAEVQSGVCGNDFSTYAIITVEEPTVAGTLSNTVAQICEGSSTGAMTLVGYTGSIVKWQSRHNGGSWTDIAHTLDVYSEVPALSGIWEYRVFVQNGVCVEEISNVVSVDVIAQSIAGTLTAPLTAICENTSTGLMSVTGYTGNIVRWQKRFNSGPWADIANTADTYEEVIATPGTWSFRVVLQSGICDEVFTNNVNIDVVSMTVGGEVQGNLTEICFGESTDLLVLTGSTGSVIMWQKRLNGGAWTDIVNTTATYTETPDQAGTWEYRAQVQSGNCASEYSDIYTIEVFDIPVADFSYVIDDYTVTFTNLSTNATTYFWQFGDSNTSTDVHPIHTYATSGVKTSRLTAYNGVCEHFYQTNIMITVSVEEIESSSFVSVFPNPSDDGNVNIAFMLDGQTEFELTVYDATGKVMHKEMLSGLFNGKVHNLYLKDIATGVYRIKLVNSEMSVEKQLIVR
jgi:PKD repeat protein